MKFLYTEHVLSRLAQLHIEVRNANIIDYQNRLQVFKEYCEQTPVLANVLAQLPDAFINIFDFDWIKLVGTWPGGREDYAVRWNAIKQMVADPRGVEKASQPLIIKQYVLNNNNAPLPLITQLFVDPTYDYLIDQVKVSSGTLYILLRYKRWVEWFMADILRDIYTQASKQRKGEVVLDDNLRGFLFEGGIDYPFSQPASPGGKVDIVAGLETGDPLVLEVKVWDSSKGYRVDRVRDGLRQVIEYADKYGKDRGYVVVFNLDEDSLEFESPTNADEWPARLDHGGKTYYFIAVNIAEQTKPISQKDKGASVKTNTVRLDTLLG